MNWKEKIDRDFKVSDTRYGKGTWVLTKSQSLHGYFKDFDDAHELKEQDKFRFVIYANQQELKNSLQETGQYNLELTHIVDCNEVITVRECMSIDGAKALINSAIGHINRTLHMEDDRRLNFRHINMKVTKYINGKPITENLKQVEVLHHMVDEMLSGPRDQILCIELEAELINLADTSDIQIEPLEKLITGLIS